MTPRRRGARARVQRPAGPGPELTVVKFPTKDVPVLDQREEGFVELSRSSKQPTRQPPNLLFHPDGRIQISTGAVEWLWPSNPAAGESGDEEDAYPTTLRVRLFAKWPRDGGRRAERLVVIPASRDEEGALVANPVGRKEVRWPLVYVVRAARFVRQLGIYGHVRYLAELVKFRRSDGTEVPALAVDLSSPVEGSPDQLMDCILEWKRQAPAGQPVPRKQFLEQIKQVAGRIGVPIVQRHLEAYVRENRAALRRAGVEFRLSGKTTFKEVEVVDAHQ